MMLLVGEQMTRSTNILEEEEIVRLIWKSVRAPVGHDPFNDDVAWVPSKSHRYLIEKADMLVAATDCPKQMTVPQIARKSVTSCMSDFAAKGVKPSYCILSIGLPAKLANRKFVTGLSKGFAEAQKKYGVDIIAGDMNATSKDVVIDCSLFGFCDKLVRRSGAKPGDMVGVSGTFGHQSAGLLLLLGNARSDDPKFSRRATNSVLEPVAKMELGVKIAPYLSSSIDSSDGLALSLYHLAESSQASIEVSRLPISDGVERFAGSNALIARNLVLFGGEEFEIVCTFDPKHRALLASYGILTIGTVLEKSKKPVVYHDDKKVPRRGWLHFQR